MDDGGEAHDDGRLHARPTEDVCAGQVGDVMGYLRISASVW